MADTGAQLEACKMAANKYRSQLQNAATKDEALESAIGAAENLMMALKLSHDLDEKKQLKLQCAAVMDTADRIKKNTSWSPHVTPPAAATKQEQIGQWAAGVAVTNEPASEHRDFSCKSTQPSHGLHASDYLRTSAPKFPSSAFQSVSSYQTKASATAESHREISSKVDRKDASPTESQSRSDPETVPIATSVSCLQVARETTSTAAPRTSQRVRRLAEPVSSRTRSKREDIILLKASMVSGFKCPPWTKAPAPSEFERQQGAELFTDTHDLSLSPYQRQFFKDWTRAQQAIPPRFMVPKDSGDTGPTMSSSHTIDLVQDAATDCSVVTSLCAGIARYERGHDQMLTNKVYPFDKQLGRPVPSTNGKYIVRLNFNGCWRKVVIDDRLPVSSTHRLLHVIDRRNPALLWPVLLEKAYLKVRGGYDFPGSSSCSDLWTMTGWVPEQVFLQESDTVPGQIWTRIYNAFQYGDVLVTVGTGRMSKRQERELGLEGQHSYVVLDMKESNEDCLLLIKNPWVEGKGWKGPRPPAGTAFEPPTSNHGTITSLETYHYDSVPTPDRPHPTTFWIGLEQVIQHFESLYLNWNPGLFAYRQDVHFEWTVDVQQPPGGYIVNHPQFTFSSKSSGATWFLLSRHFRDTAADVKDESDTFNDGSVLPDTQVDSIGEHPKGYMSIYVCDGHGDRLYIKESYLESSDYVTTPQCLLRFDATANAAYTVVVDQDELPPSLYTFTLTAFSNSVIRLEQAAAKYPRQHIETGAWTRQSAGGSTSSLQYFDNPQYSLEVKERGALAILLTGTHDHPLHVKLALGYGKRLHRLQSRDVLVDSGNHRSGCVFAEIQDLQPGLYTILCSLFEAGQQGDYTLRIDSTSDLVVKQVPRDGAGLLSMKLSHACFGAHVHKVAAALLPHRLASYTIIARFIKATSPRWTSLGKLARSPLRLSVEIGRGPERKFVIASEGGEYADSATVRSESVNIDPTMAQQGDMWLVLDRLSGPGGPIEEWYEVEMYTDVPQACSVGVWRNWDD